MADTNVIPGNLDLQGDLRVRGQILPSLPRTALTQDDLAVFPVDPTRLRVWDAFQTVLPGTSASDDLGVYTGTFGTGTPYVATYNIGNAGSVSMKARFMFCLPENYVAGQSVHVRFSAGMLTAVASSTATLDLEVYKSNRDSTKTGSDLCATAAQSINSTTFANKSFELTTTSLSPGDWLDCLVTVATNSSGVATSIGVLGAIEFLIDVQG